jgi:hypothetical protein
MLSSLNEGSIRMAFDERIRSACVAGLLVSVTWIWADTPAAQERHDHHSPYADLGDSGIAGLSAVEVQQLENGEGMGLALPAELNRYPGPKHVLDLSDELDLTEEQHVAVKAIFDRMKEEARRVGLRVIEKEQALFRRFEHRHIDEELLRKLTSEIGALRGELRFTHLRAHLETAAVLSEDQIARYQLLRGYRESD